MSTTIKAIHLLQDKLQNLLSNYEFLKNENQILLKSTTQMKYQLLEKEQQVAKQQKEYNLLKIAKTIDGSSTETKQKINALIKEIDKCIVQLQE